MSDHALDNPIWSSLRSRHCSLALGDRSVLRYPAEIAPFVAFERGCEDPEAVLQAWVAPGEKTFGLGPMPTLSRAWSFKGGIMLSQMVCDRELPLAPGPDVVLLGEPHREEVLALTALVYPHYFRPRTMALGRYFGIFEEGRLAAMAGERMATPEAQEISAVCTHPDFLGRGYARRLMAWLGNDILGQGRLPFLHVSYENLRAKQMYDRLGYRERFMIEHWSLRRSETNAPAST